MTEDTNKLAAIEARLRDASVNAAYHAAANFCAIAGFKGQSLNWPGLGAAPSGPDRKGVRDIFSPPLAQFVRHHGRDIVPEALFRFAQGVGVHDFDISQGWPATPFMWRAAYTAFCSTLICYDRLVDDEMADLRARLQAAAGPTKNPLDDVPVEDTILEQYEGLMAKRPDMVSVRTGGDDVDAGKRALLPAGTDAGAAPVRADAGAETATGEDHAAGNGVSQPAAADAAASSAQAETQGAAAGEASEEVSG